jgi:subtilase family serine protease
MITTGSPTLGSSTAISGGNVDLASSWTVKNQGTGTSAAFTNGYYLSTDTVITTADIYMGGNSDLGLAAGISFAWGGPTSVAVPPGLVAGAYYFGILVDRGDVVAESDETNNYVSTPITIETPPDLTITSGPPTATPSTVVAGGTVTLSAWTLSNIGTLDASAFLNGYYLSTDGVITSTDTFLGSNGNVVAGSSSYVWAAPTLTIPLGTAPGSYFIGILVDRTNVIAEGDETNNYVRRAITVVAPAPDLTITRGRPIPTPSSVAPGGTVTLPSWTVKNQGTADAALFFNGFYLSTDAIITSADTFLDNNANALVVGASFVWGGPTLTIPLGTAPGVYYVGILVDNGDAITESDELNNYVSAVITVTP